MSPLRFPASLLFLHVLLVGAAACGDDPGAAKEMKPPSGEPTEEVAADCAALDREIGVPRPEGWSADSHCKLATPRPEAVFASDRVGKLTIRMTAVEYAAMQADLEEIAGPISSEGPCEGLTAGAACEIDWEVGTCHEVDGLLECIAAADPVLVEACAGKAAGDACVVAADDAGAGVCVQDEVHLYCSVTGEPGEGAPVDGEEGEPGGTDPEGGDFDVDPCAGKADGAACAQGGDAAPGVCVTTTGPRICQVDALDRASLDDVEVEAAASFWEREPAYFHADLELDGVRFASVGIRYKGNNALSQSLEREKRPLRIKADRWEKEIPAITDQRIHGFQDLSLASNQTDATNLHQVMMAAVLRDHGVPAPHAGFVEVSIDTGDGPRLLGLYAISEVPDDALLDRAFAGHDGNLYKPDGRGAHFASFIEASLHKQNNRETGADDVEAFVAALHASRADRPAWRAGLRARFDIDGFVDFFAINQAIGNWDTYGGYAHNFYLYGGASGQLAFIPWDFDLAFDASPGSDLTLQTFDGDWPLLQAVSRDAELMTRYHDALAAFGSEELETGKLARRIDAAAALIRPALEREATVRRTAVEDFDDALVVLEAHLAERATAVRGFVGPAPR